MAVGNNNLIEVNFLPENGLALCEGVLKIAVFIRFYNTTTKGYKNFMKKMEMKTIFKSLQK